MADEPIWSYTCAPAPPKKGRRAGIEAAVVEQSGVVYKLRLDAMSFERSLVREGAHSRLVAREKTVRLAALSPVSQKRAGVAEVWIYVTATAPGRGVGRALLRGPRPAWLRCENRSLR
jgi:hypothetical protein